MKHKISRILCTALCCAPLLASAQTSEKSTSPKRLYQEGQTLFQQKAYAAAISPLQAYVRQMNADGKPLPDTGERQEAEYMLVCAAYELRDPKSIDLLRAFLDEYPDTPHANRIYALIASAYFFEGNYDDALAMFNSVRLDLLGSEERDDMTYRLATCYLKTGNVKEAAIWFVIHIPYLVIWAIVIVIIVLKHGTKGFTSFSSILIGIIVGYILVSIMALVLPTTFTYVDDTGATVEATKAWVLNWDKVAQAKWFAVPALMPVKWVFDARAIVPILIMFIVTAVETVGDISGITEGGLGREATDKELSGGVMCDGLGSSFAALFGVLPNTSFSQNVGLVAMNKVVNRFCIATGGIFLIACGLFPKLAALISIMPQSVLGGAAVMMFSSIVVSGIQLITKWPVGPRNVTIVSVALGLGYGLGSNTAILVHLPQAISLIFGGSGIVPAAVFAIILNIVLPKDEKTDVERAEEMLEKVKNK